MKRNGLILLFLWILSLTGISFYGGEISYGFFFLFTLIFVLSVGYILIVIALFRIYQNLEGRGAVANQPAVFHFILQNESPVLFSGIRVRFYSSFSSITGLDDRGEYELHPYSGIRRQTNIICKYRGDYEVGIKSIEVTDFFRLFTICRRNPSPLKIRVNPRIVSLEKLENAEVSLSSVQDPVMNRNETDVPVRDYLPGDDPRFINWKATGVLDKPMIRQRTGEVQRGFAVVMDPCRCSEHIEEYLPIENKILETVIALTLFLSRKAVPAEVFFYEERTESCVVDHTGGFDAFYERMAMVRFHKEHPIDILFEELRRGGRIFSVKAVFLVLHEWNEAAGRFAEEMIRSGIAVTAYVITDTEFSEVHSGIHRMRIPVHADLSEVL